MGSIRSTLLIIVMGLTAAVGCCQPRLAARHAPPAVLEHVDPFPPTDDRLALDTQRLLNQTVQIVEQTLVVGMFPMGEPTIESGTGVVIGVRNGKSLILTNRHVVVDDDDEGAKKRERKDRDTPPIPRIIVHRFIVVKLSGERCEARVLVVDPKEDLGLVEASCTAGDPVILEPELPPTGAMLTDVSETTGFHPSNAFAVLDGRMLGLSGERMATSIPASPGSSGSGIFYRGRLVGILTTVQTEFHHLSAAVPAARILTFLVTHPWVEAAHDGG